MFEIENSHVIQILDRELQEYNSFQANISSQIERLRSDLDLIDCKNYAENLRYNKNMQRLCLERAAIALELVGLFKENAGDTIDYITIYRMYLTLKNAPESKPALRMRLGSIGKTLDEALKVAIGLGFTTIYDRVTGITRTISEFADELDEEPNQDPIFALYGNLIIRLIQPWDRDAEIYELE